MPTFFKHLLFCTLFLCCAAQSAAQQYLVVQNTKTGKRYRFDTNERIHVKTSKGHFKGELTNIVEMRLPEQPISDNPTATSEAAKISKGYIEIEGQRVYLRDIDFIKMELLRRFARGYAIQTWSLTVVFFLTDLIRFGRVQDNTKNLGRTYSISGAVLWFLPVRRLHLNAKWRPIIVNVRP